MAVKLAILALLEAKPDTGADLAAFLQRGRAIAVAEEGTVSWYAFKIDDTHYGIFDTFETEDAREDAFRGPEPRRLVLRGAVGALVVPGLPRPIAAGIRAPRAPRVVLEEHQHTAGGAAGPQVAAMRSGQKIDGVRGQRGQDDIGAGRTVYVAGRQWAATRLPDRDRGSGRLSAGRVDRLERRPWDLLAGDCAGQSLAHDGS